MLGRVTNQTSASASFAEIPRIQINTNIVDKIFIPHSMAVRGINRIERCFITSESSLEPTCLLLVGDSRAGKSRIFEYTVSQHMSFRVEEGLVVPVLKVSTPSSPTVRKLASALLRSLGDPLANKGTEEERTDRLVKLLVAAKVRMIILDEFQHFYDKGSDKVMHTVADWLKLLIDNCRVSLIVGGLPTCQAVLNQNEQLAGRFMGQIRLQRFDWQDEDSRQEFRGVLKAFQEALTDFEWPDLTTYEMAFRFYSATGGLIGYLVKILRAAVHNAIFEGNPVIDLDALKRAYEDAVYIDDSSILIPAFDKSFVAQATDSLLQRAKQVGISKKNTPSLKRAVTKKVATSLGEALRG